jgi:hypothetical protein
LIPKGFITTDTDLIENLDRVIPNHKSAMARIHHS